MSESVSLEDLVDTFQEFNLSKKRKPDTIKGYQAHLNRFIKFMAGLEKDKETGKLYQARRERPGLHDVQRITIRDIDAYRGYLVGRGLADHSTNSYLRAVRVLLRWATSRKYLAECPEVEFIEMEKQRPKPGLHRDEIEKLLAAADEEQNEFLRLRARAVVLVLHATGMRVSELSKACWQNITSAKVEEKEYQVLFIESAKSQPPRRVILNERVWEAVKLYRSALLAVLDGGQLPETIFVTEAGERLTRRGLQHLVYRLKEHSQIQVSPHKFRRTFAREWFKRSQGRELDTLMEIGGWKSIEIIKQYYADFEDETLIRAYQRNGPHWDDGI